MNYDIFVEKLIEKTKTGKLIWNKERKLPPCTTLSCKNVLKLFYTDINDDITFYLVEYSYESYLPDFDQICIDCDIAGFFIQDNIEVDYFNRCDMGKKENLQNLIEIIIQKKYNVAEQLKDFVDNND